MTAYRAPAADGEFLAVPPFADQPRMWSDNAARLDASDVSIGGVPLREFRSAAVDEILSTAHDHLEASGEPAPARCLTLVASGHQPEFFHPGVWAKNFALHGLAAATGRSALNLIVDNDAVKSTALAVPVVDDDPTKVRVEAVPFDRPGIDLPYEEHRAVDRAIFDAVPDRVRELTRRWPRPPMLLDRWPTLVAMVGQGVPFWEAAARLRRGVEREWGVVSHELPVSRLAETPSFGRFAQHILANLLTFAESYNGAIRNYRVRNKLTSLNHPAPELQPGEAPFWVWCDTNPRRRRLFLRDGDLFAEDVRIGRFSDVGVFDGGWKLRPRALTLTLFVRMFVADGFIHGIGGGKYDEVTDDLIRRFFGIEPPGLGVVTATMRLPLPRFPSTPSKLRQAERKLRDLDWNPDLYGADLELAFRKRELVAAEPQGRTERRHWFRDLQTATRAMRPAVAEQVEPTESLVERMRTEIAANKILDGREYSWLLFPEERLREAYRNLAAGRSMNESSHPSEAHP